MILDSRLFKGDPGGHGSWVDKEEAGLLDRRKAVVELREHLGLASRGGTHLRIVRPGNVFMAVSEGRIAELEAADATWTRYRVTVESFYRSTTWIEAIFPMAHSATFLMLAAEIDGRIREIRDAAKRADDERMVRIREEISSRNAKTVAALEAAMANHVFAIHADGCIVMDGERRGVRWLSSWPSGNEWSIGWSPNDEDWAIADIIRTVH